MDAQLWIQVIQKLAYQKCISTGVEFINIEYAKNKNRNALPCKQGLVLNPNHKVPWFTIQVRIWACFAASSCKWQKGTGWLNGKDQCRNPTKPPAAINRNKCCRSEQPRKGISQWMITTGIVATHRPPIKWWALLGEKIGWKRVAHEPW